MMKPVLEFGTRRIASGLPCFVIAEAGVNHNGDLGMAHRLIDAAVDAKVDCIKFQTFKASKLASANAPKAKYQESGTPSGESQLEMLQKLELSHAAHLELIAHAEERGILFLSTPFEEESADELVGMGLPLLKISSGELTNLPFLAHLARKRLPLILSTGMATLGEVERAVETLDANGAPSLALLHCVSNYPANPADCNLRAMQTLERAFGTPVGFSDHTEGNDVALASVALGGCIVEKHFTLDRNLPGPDHRASLEPAALTSLVQGIRTVEAALGDGRKRPKHSEADTAKVARKSIVAATAIRAGSVIDQQSLALRRPGTGLESSMLEYVVGRSARCDIAEGALISLEMLA
jgi:N-acetylneuraminate synthase/N,N'-diacetyllegionaminate synthase